MALGTALLCGPAAAQMGGGFPRPGALTARERTAVIPIEISEGAIGVEVVLQISDSARFDLDLHVLLADPRRVPFSRPACESDGTTQLEICRVFVLEDVSMVFARVTLVRGEFERGGRLGRGAPDIPYRLDRTLLFPPKIQGTDLVGADARPLRPGPRGVDSSFVFSDPPDSRTFQHLYHLDLPADEEASKVVFELSAPELRREARLSFFDSEGSRIDPSYEAGSPVIDLGRLRTRRLFALVSLESRTSIFKQPAYKLAAISSTAIPLEIGSRPISLSGEEATTYQLILGKGDLATFVAHPSPTFRYSLHGKGEGGEIPLQMPNPWILEDRETAILGQAMPQFSFLYFGLGEEQAVDLRIEELDETERGERARARFFYPRGEWRVEIHPHGPYILDFRRQEPRRLGDGVFELELGPEQQMAVFSVGPRSAAEGQPLSAWILDEGAKYLDIALCNGLGHVLDVDSRAVRATWPEDTFNLFVVLFREPGAPEVEPVPFVLEIVGSGREPREGGPAGLGARGAPR